MDYTSTPTTPGTLTTAKVEQTMKNLGSKVSDTAKKGFSKMKALSAIFIPIGIGLVCLLIYLIVNGIVSNNKGKKSERTNFYSSSKDASVQTTIKSKDINKGKLTMPSTWTTWLYIDRLNYKNQTKMPKWIFSRGQSPMVLLDNSINNIKLYLLTKKGQLNVTKKSNNKNYKFEEIVIENVPLNTWFQLGFVLRNQEAELYMNGRLIHTVLLKGTLVPNTSDLIVNRSGGFIGKVQSLAFYPIALEPKNIYFNYENDKNRLSEVGWKNNLPSISKCNISTPQLDINLSSLKNLLPGEVSETPGESEESEESVTNTVNNLLSGFGL